MRPPASTGWTTRPRWPTCWTRLLADRRMRGRPRGGAHRRRRPRRDRRRRARRGRAGDPGALGEVTRALRCAPCCGRAPPSPTRSTSPARATGPAGLRARRWRRCWRRRRSTAVLLTGYFGGYSTGHDEPDPARDGGLAHDRRRPRPSGTSRSSCRRSSPTARAPGSCVDAAIPVHRDIDRACDVLAGLVTRPAPEPETGSFRRPRRSPTRRTTPRGRCSPTPGIGFVPARVVHHLDALRKALAEPEMSFPVVLKAVGSLHKSDAGGVVLGLPDADGGARTPTSTWWRASPRRPSRSR